MATTTQQRLSPHELQASIFDRVLVGIDGSPASLDAATQAAALATGPVTLLAAYQLTEAVVGAGMAPGPVYIDEAPIRERAEQALQSVARDLASVDVRQKICSGRAWKALLEEIARERHTLVAVGSHGAGRAKGILMGSTATELVHKAPCSVLVARTPLKKRFPGSIIVGVDGSKESLVAEAVARDLARRFDAPLDRYENVPDPVSSLVSAAMEVDLVVVGSRGLRGLRSLGSVSERVAHEAACSVLVVR